MIETDFTFIIQLANFLVMLWFLNRFVFIPVLGHIDMREGKMKDMSDEAQNLAKRGGETLEKYESEMMEIRRASSELISSARKEAQASQAKILEAAKLDFRKSVEKSRQELKAEVESASETLSTEMESFAKSMAGKVLGREVSQ